MAAIRQYLRQFGTIGRINTSLRKLARENISVGVIGQNRQKFMLSPDYLSITGITLNRAGRLTEAGVSKVELLLRMAAQNYAGNRLVGEKMLNETLVLERTERKNTFSSLIGGGNRIREIKRRVRGLEGRGLQIPFLNSLMRSLRLGLYRAGVLNLTWEINYLLKKIPEAYEKKCAKLPTGKLDILGAIEQLRAAAENYFRVEGAEVTRELETEHVIAAVRDNILLEEDSRAREETESIYQLVDQLGVKEGEEGEAEAFDVREIELGVVRTIHKWLPGGAPTLMRFAENDGKAYLVSEAVALGDKTIRTGESLLKRKLGEIYYPLPEGINDFIDVSDAKRLSAIPNPYVRAFARGEVAVEQINYETYKDICAGFIGKDKLNWAEEKLMAWVSWPGPRDAQTLRPILWVPLKRIDPRTGKYRKIGLIAVVAREITEEYVHKIKSLARATATKLRYIDMIEELRRGARMEGMLFLAQVAAHDTKNVLLQARFVNDEQQKRLKEVSVSALLLAKKLEIGISVDALDWQTLSLKLKQCNEAFDQSKDLLADIDEVARGMLALAKKGEGKIALKDYLQKAFNLYAKALKTEGIALALSLSSLGETDGIEVLQEDMNRLIENLVGNAVEAFRGKEITDKKIAVSALRYEDSIRIFFRDNAGGIPRKIVEKVFGQREKKVTTKEGGTGLGLPTIIYVVEKNGGEIQVNVEGGETKFSINFPVIHVEGEKKRAAEQIMAIPDAPALTVAYVDDKESLHQIMRIGILSRIGFREENMAFFSTPKAFQEKLAKGEMGMPDIVISDRELERASGVDFLKWLKEKCESEGKKVPKLAIFSGHAQPSSADAPLVKELGIKWIEKGADMTSVANTIVRFVLGREKAGASFKVSAPAFENDYSLFGARLGHDMNNLINPLYMYLEMARQDLSFLADTQEYYTEYIQAIGGMRSNFAKQDPLKSPLESPTIEKFMPIWERMSQKQRENLVLLGMIYLDEIDGQIKKISEAMDLVRESQDEARIKDLLVSAFQAGEAVVLANRSMSVASNFAGNSIHQKFTALYQFLGM